MFELNNFKGHAIYYIFLQNLICFELQKCPMCHFQNMSEASHIAEIRGVLSGLRTRLVAEASLLGDAGRDWDAIETCLTDMDQCRNRTSNFDFLTLVKEAIDFLRGCLKVPRTSGPDRVIQQCRVFSRKLLSASLYLLREYAVKKAPFPLHYD